MAKFILTVKDGEVHQQGRVIGKGPEPGSWKVRLYSWIDGRPTIVEVLTKAMLKGALWFDNAAEWNTMADKLSAEQMARMRRRS